MFRRCAIEKVVVVGIDLAKQVFQVHFVNAKGKTILNKQVRRNQLLKTMSNLPPCLVGMEACGSSHYWAREIQQLGHQVKLMAPQYVKAYVKTNKNDAADAEAIAEAVTRPGMRFVDIKSSEQQSVLLLHRERDGLMKERTSLINRIRATLSEFGIIAPKGSGRLKRWFRDEFCYSEAKLPELMKRHVQRLLDRLRGLEEAVALLDNEIDAQSRSDEACGRLEAVPGIGRLTASALRASVGNASAFKNGREFSAWLGLVPRQLASGGKPRLLGISKRGDAYLRRMLIHGARAVLRHMNPKREVTQWLDSLSRRRHRNVVIVALANKLARIAWALLYHQRNYDDKFLAAGV